MDRLEFYLFGQPRLERGGKAIDISLRKALALLAYLVVTKGEYSRDYLATLLWPESDPSNARASLRRTLYRINKSASEELLTTSADSIVLNPSREISVDVEAFRRITDEWSETLRSSAENEPKRNRALENAAALYTDDFLAGFSISDCHQFEEWRFFEAENLRASLVRILEQLIDTYQKQTDYDRAIQHGRRLLSLDSLSEDAHRILMRLYAISDQHSAALRQYTECERILEQELGVLPQPETTRLYETIRQHRQIDITPSITTQPQVKYIPSGDIHIAYQVVGEGPIDIIFIGGFISHLHQFWEEPNLAAFIHDLASFSRFIVFDKRGEGLSDRVGYPPTLEDTMDDILAVMRAVESKHAVLFSMLEGGPTSIVFTATYPELVSGLILYATFAKGSRTEDYPWVITWEQYDTWLERITENWGEALNLEYYAPSRAEDPRLREWWAKTIRLSSSPGGIKAVLQVMREIDVRDILPVIRAPTLVLHRKGDMAIRVEAGRHLARHIPGAKFVELEGDDHWFFVGDTQSILVEIQNFVENLGTPLPPERMVMTILALQSLQEKGVDAKVLSSPMQTTSNDAFIWSEITRYQGKVISRERGRIMVGFDGPSRAIHCTRSLVSSAKEHAFSLRASLHTGECELVSGELKGVAVQIAEAILGTDSPYEILVSSTVKDLVAGSGFQFYECGKCTVEGISGEWAIYSLEE
ncbi:MAG: alpha/beta hydrolase [Anaerolineaceae bacterium]|nr:MAG: alpha/beta hydrolase [Anaerolineaceae bacterium]